MKEIAAAIAKFRLSCPKITKDAANDYYSSKYASFDHILKLIQVPMNDAGITFIQVPDGEFKLKTTIIHLESGEMIEGTINICPVKNEPQSQGSALTYARRYALCSMLGIVAEEDDDGNAANGYAGKQSTQRPPYNPAAATRQAPAYALTAPNPAYVPQKPTATDTRDIQPVGTAPAATGTFVYSPKEEPSIPKKCTKCGKTHFGKYDKCVDCWRNGNSASYQR